MESLSVTGNYLRAQHAARDYPSQIQLVVLAFLLQIPEGERHFLGLFICGGRMIHRAAKSPSCPCDRALLGIAAPSTWGSCFRTWSTAALLDYFQKPRSAKTWPNSSAKRDRDRSGKDTEAIRAELQKLLRHAYVENQKAAQTGSSRPSTH